MTSGQCQVLSFVFYEDEHVEDNNPCVINCSKCNASGMAGTVPCLPIFTGFEVINGYAGSMTFKCATAKENGELIFEDL